MSHSKGTGEARLLHTRELRSRDRYQLLTSLVVPRPIGWISTRSARGVANLAPFSYFAALSARPMLVGVSIGSRGTGPKDTLTNIRDTGAFCVNVVTLAQWEAMNRTAAEHAPEIDEFTAAGLEPAESVQVDAPFVADCPAVMECELFKEVDLDGSGNALILGEVLVVRVAARLRFLPDTYLVDPADLEPVGRLGGDSYALPSRLGRLARPE